MNEQHGRACAWCESPLPEGARSNRVYCSATCRARYHEEVAKADGRWERASANERQRRKPEQAQCMECGTEFMHRHKGRKYCSQQCTNRAFHKRRMASGRKQARTLHERICIACGGTWKTVNASAQHCSPACIAAGRFGPDRLPRPRPMTERMRAARRKQRRAAFGTTGKKVVWTEGPCGRCGQRFLAKTSAQTPARYCSGRCKQADIADRHRAAKRQALVAPVYRKKIFERDRYRCHICGKKVRMDKVAPHPLSPTLDHLIPLSLGGTHEPANVATAHFLCNSTKSNLGAGDQLALLG